VQAGARGAQADAWAAAAGDTLPAKCSLHPADPMLLVHARANAVEAQHHRPQQQATVSGDMPPKPSDRL
jgi:hypothetical protein